MVIYSSQAAWWCMRSPINVLLHTYSMYCKLKKILTALFHSPELGMGTGWEPELEGEDGGSEAAEEAAQEDQGNLH